MISWIQNRLIKNGKWIFSILLAVIIVAFVFVIGETPGLPTGGPGSQRVDFYGVNLLNPAEIDALDRQTSIITFMKVGDVPFSAESIRELTYYRIATLHLANHYRIPVPDRETLQRYILEMPRFQNRNGQFDPSAYQDFLDQVRENPAYSGGLLDRAIQDEYRIDRLSELLGAQGHTLPYDVALLGEMTATRWDVRVASRRYNSFQPELEFTEEELKTFYRANAEDYEIPRRQMLSWIYFKPELYRDDVATPDDRVLVAYVDSHFYRYLDAREDRDPETGQVLEPVELLEKRRERVLADWKREQARAVARRKAEDFASRLYDRQLGMNSEEFKRLLDDLPNPTGEFNPVSRNTNPRQAGEGATWDILQAARGLNPMQWFTDAVEFREGYGVVFLTGIEEAHVPELAAVRENVERNFRESLRRREFNRTGAALVREVRELVEEGHDFETAVAMSSLEKSDTLLSELNRMWRRQIPLNSLSDREYFMPVTRYRDITLDSHPSRFPTGLFSAMRGRQPGEVTEMVTESGMGYIAFIESVTKPDPLENPEPFELARENLEFASTQLLIRNAFREMLDRGAPRDFGLPGIAR